MFGQDDHQEEAVDTAATIQPTTDDTVQPVASNDTTLDSGSTDDSAAVSADTTANETADSSSEASEAAAASSTPLVTPAEPPADDTSAGGGLADDNLLQVKKDALSDLAPLISHLDQSPEEHFKTTMMLIQATDDSNYIKAAYESAKQITDESARAQALLDIVNEINYFTQTHNNTSDEN